MTPVFQGFPIRKSQDQSSFTSSPGLIAGYNVLHRLLVPRHPPTALSSLLFHYKDARVHCAVLKKRAGPGRRACGATATGPQKRCCFRNRPFRAQQRAWVRSTALEVPLRRQAGGCTVSWVVHELNGQCSTEVLASAIDVCDGTEGAGQVDYACQ